MRADNPNWETYEGGTYKKTRAAIRKMYRNEAKEHGLGKQQTKQYVRAKTKRSIFRQGI